MLDLLLADGRLPVGGHTSSAGLEAALAGGWSSARMPEFIEARLASTVPVEAGTAVITVAALLNGEDLRPVQRAWAARTPSHRLRAQSLTLGRGYLRLLHRLHPNSIAVQAIAGLDENPARPVVMGAVGFSFGLDTYQVARWLIYDEIATITSAALKLNPIDPLDTVRWSALLAEKVDNLAGTLGALTEPGQIPATANPQFEAWQHEHADRTHKLFSS